MALGKHIEARKSYLLAIEDGDETIQSHAHFGLGEMFEKLNQLKNAREQYKLAIKLDPDFYNPRKRLEILSIPIKKSLKRDLKPGGA